MNITLTFTWSSITYKPLHDFSSVHIIKGKLGSYPFPKIHNTLCRKDKDILIIQQCH